MSDRPQSYSAGALKAAFAQVPKVFEPLDVNDMSLAELEEDLHGATADGGSGNWDERLPKMIHRLMREGYTDEQIIDYCPKWTLEGYTDKETIKAVKRALPGRRAWREGKNLDPKPVEPVNLNIIRPTEWFGREPSPREWIVEDWVPANHVTGVYGDGGIGKTLVVQQLLTAVASGEPWLGMDVKPSKAFGFLCEDFENDIHITQQAINRDLGITMRSLGDLAFMSRVGEDNVLMSFDKSDTGMLTPLYYELVSSIKDFGAKVVVIDTLADTFGGSENVRTQARQFVANCLGRMAREIGGTVIVCGHPSIAGMQSGQGYGGSTAWNNTFRSRLYLTRPEDDGDNNARTLERKKANYASTGEPLQLLWADGVLGLAEQKQTSGGPTNNVSLDLARTILTEIEAKWNAKKPYSSANNSGERYVGKMIQKNFKMKKKAAQELVHVWWQNGVIDDQVVDTHTKLKGLKVTKWPG